MLLQKILMVIDYYRPCNSTYQVVCTNYENAVCQVVADSGDHFSCGINTYYVVESLRHDKMGFNITFKIGDGERKSSIAFICSSEEEGFQVAGIVENPKKHYHFVWRTPEACPIQSKQGGTCRVFNKEEDIEANCSVGHRPMCWIDSDGSLRAECIALPDDPLPLPSLSHSFLGSLWQHLYHLLFGN